MTVEIRKKLVIVGDSNVGKSCLLTILATHKFPETKVPGVVENLQVKMRLRQQEVILHLYDTGGQDEHNLLRPLVYPDTDVILICFSVDSPSSLKSILEKWNPEVKYFCPHVRILLIANKTDLRKDLSTIEALAKVDEKPVSYKQGREVAAKIRAVAYIESSAKSGEGLNSIFKKVTAILERPRCHCNRRRNCIVL